MRRNINTQDNPRANINNVNTRGKSIGTLNNNVNNMNNNNLNNNFNKNTNLNRAPSSNIIGNNNPNNANHNNNNNSNKNFRNLKGNNKVGVPDSAVISDQNYKIFQNQDYFNLDQFNFYGNPNQNNNNNNNYNSNNNNSNSININNSNNKNIYSGGNNFQNNNQPFKNNENKNFRGNIANRNENNNNYPVEVQVSNKKLTQNVNSQIHFDDFSNKNNSNNENNFGGRGKRHFINNDNSTSNLNLNQMNKNINNKNNDRNSLSDNNNRGGFNQNFNNNNNNKSQSQNNGYSKTILLKIKAAKQNGTINISNMNLSSLPKEIFDDSVRFDDINWWELVDIKKIDASNNQIDETFNNENISFEAIPNINYLKFSGNNFTIIPDSINSLYNLKFLDFSDNKIRILSENIRGLKNVVDLNLSNNTIAAIPNEIGKLSELEILNISQNKISAIPQGFGNALKLKRLDLSNNFLDNIPNFFGNLHNLEELILFKNKIREIQNNSLTRLSNLKYLDLHNNNLDFFSEIPRSEKLDTLILGYNKIENIENLRNCPNLTVLDVNNNKLENFPEDVLNLKNIITLNLMNNSINDIPPSLCYLNKLVRLNIEGNPLRKINSKLRSSNAEQIKSYLKTRIVGDEDNDFSSNLPMKNNNNYEDFNDDNKNIKPEENISKKQNNDKNINSNINNNQQVENLQPNLSSKESNINLLNHFQNNYLKLMNMDIENVPVENFKKYKIFNCGGLDLSNNKIKDISFFENLPLFSDMQEFKININKLTYVSNSLINFKTLRILEIKNNLLTEFLDNLNFQTFEEANNSYNLKKINKPINNTNTNKKNSNNFYERNNTNKLFNNEDDFREEETCKPFPNLEYLDLSNNKIRNFPLVLKYCTKLNTILFSNNAMTNIDCLKEFNNSNLFTLEFGGNKITALPEKLYQNIPNLKHLGMDNNEIKNVPTDFCFMKNLNKLTISGNPIKLLRSNIISGGTKSILEYLRKMHRFTDEELKLEGESSNFLSFNNQPEEKISNKKRVYKNEQSPMDKENEIKSPKINKLLDKGNFNSNYNKNDVRAFGDVEMEIENHNNKNLFHKNEKNSNKNNNFDDKFNEISVEPKQVVFSSNQEELEDVNRQILIVESEMGEGNMPMFKKTDLRKKLNELIRRRANIMKNIDS